MKTPALLMLSVLVALGHWLLLVPGSATLVQVFAPASRSDSALSMRPEPLPSAAAPVRVLQTRRIESPSPARSATALQAVSTQSRATSAPSMIRATKATAPALQTPAQETMPETTSDAVTAPADKAASVDPDPTVAVAADGPAARQAEAQPAVGPGAELAIAHDPLKPPLAMPLIAQLQLPKPARLHYDITGQSRGLGYRASGVLDWQQDGSRYDARLVASVFFLGNRTLSSQGDVTADGLAPTRFADKARSEQAAHFQADKGRITFSANTPDAPWQRGAQDRLSVFFQLAGMLAGQAEGVATGTRIPVYTASARSADTWTFLVDDIESLSLPAGTMPAIKLTRQSRLDYDQLVEVWFAPSLSYWPVRIKLTQRNGDFVDQQLASVTAP